MDHESVYRRCGCRDESTGRLLGARCPGLRDLKHGSWYFSADLPSAAGRPTPPAEHLRYQVMLARSRLREAVRLDRQLDVTQGPASVHVRDGRLLAPRVVP